MILGKALQPEELQSLEVKVKNTDKEPNVNTFERNSAQVLIIWGVFLVGSRLQLISWIEEVISPTTAPIENGPRIAMGSVEGLDGSCDILSSLKFEIGSDVLKASRIEY